MKSTKQNSLTFQELILRLQAFWAERGCVLQQPYDVEVGAGTMAPETFLRVLGPKPYKVAYVQPSRRPADGRYGENPNRLFKHMQLQVILKPPPENVQELYLESLGAIGIDLRQHDIKFEEDNWESPTLGAWGIGWQVMLDGLEITQFTYFQQCGGVDLDPISAELTYGLERIAAFLQDVDSIYDIVWARDPDSGRVTTYGDVRLADEQQFSVYNFEAADVDKAWKHFELCEAECKGLLEKYAELVKEKVSSGELKRFPLLGAYDLCLKCSHLFNILDARGAISVTERVGVIARVRALALAVGIAKAWVQQQSESIAEKEEPEPAAKAREVVKFEGLLMPDFLLEIGCEEIPARMIAAASKELGERVGALLERERLAGSTVSCIDTPRRIAVLASSIPFSQPDLTEEVTGPSVSVAFKDGQPTSAAQAFAKKVGQDVAKLQRKSTPKGEYLVTMVTKKGRGAAEVLAEALPKEIASLYWPKNMYWRKPSERFVRPVRWLVAMLDGAVVPVEFGGVKASDVSRGHRILADGPVKIASGAKYEDALRDAKVINRTAREAQVRKALDAATRTISGARWREDNPLLDTVANLTEWPSVVLGNFDPEFLVLPEEVLVTVMRDHQKYFAIEDAQGKLLPHFLAVLNTDGDPQGIIQHGHERVLRARFNDARFFWNTDQKRPLRERGELLKSVTFQKDLGSYYDKMLRVQRLCSWVSEIIKESGIAVRPGVVHKAACLAKTDLTTELVKEFTELQGIVGGLYARVQHLDDGMAEATQQLIAEVVYDHYKPEFMEDSVPRSVEGAVLSICDKADSIAGMFALGLVPSGSKDPFALRRQANGMVKTIAEKKLSLSLRQLMLDARSGYRGSEAEKKFKSVDYEGAVVGFFRERAEFYLKDVLGYKYDVVNAVLASDADNVVDAIARAEAVSQVRGSEDFASISVAFKRTKNILKQAQDAKKHVASTVDIAALQDPAEKALATLIPETTKKVQSLSGAGNYPQALQEISKLRPAVDKFFDDVMVMVDDEKLRANRLALLQTLLKEFSTIADFSEIVTEGATK